MNPTELAAENFHQFLDSTAKGGTDFNSFGSTPRSAVDIQHDIGIRLPGTRNARFSLFLDALLSAIEGSGVYGKDALDSLHPDIFQLLTAINQWLHRFANPERMPITLTAGSPHVVDLDVIQRFGRFIATKFGRKIMIFSSKTPSDVFPVSGYVSWLVVSGDVLHLIYDHGLILQAAGNSRIQYQHLHEKIFLHEIAHASCHVQGMTLPSSWSALPKQENEAWLHALAVRASVVALGSRIQKILEEADRQWLAA